MEYVRAALASGLEIIAVTDHNSAEWVDVVRNAARGTTLHVFPGVEVTTPHCHLLVIFPLDFAKARIDDFLAVVGITAEKRGKQDALGEQPEFVLQKAKEFGGIVITHPQILRLALSQGFFADSVFQFHANLNCFVGGKGVGKSTVIELMRYCFDDVSHRRQLGLLS
jgi:hypothetical protein